MKQPLLRIPSMVAESNQWAEKLLETNLNYQHIYNICTIYVLTSSAFYPLGCRDLCCCHFFLSRLNALMNILVPIYSCFRISQGCILLAIGRQSSVLQCTGAHTRLIHTHTCLFISFFCILSFCEIASYYEALAGLNSQRIAYMLGLNWYAASYLTQLF